MNMTMAGLRDVIRRVITKERIITPGFSAYPSTATNISGDGTAWTVLYNNEVWDNGGDYNGTSTFTAPVTGKYLFTAMLSTVGSLTANTDARLEFVSSNRDHMHIYTAFSNIDTNTINRPNITCILDMDAGDTCYVRFTSYNGTKVIDIQNTFLSGNFEGVQVA